MLHRNSVDSMMTDDEIAQENELLAFESIFENDTDIFAFDKSLNDDTLTRSGRLKICPDIASPPMKVNCKYLRNTSEAASTSEEDFVTSSCDVNYLPSICLRFLLPDDYPSTSPPQYTLTCAWLDRSKLSEIAGKLDSLWAEQEGQEILYTWTQFLKEDLLDFLCITDEMTLNQTEFVETLKLDNLDERVMQDVGRFSDILPFVQEFSDTKEKQVFDGTPFPCDICFTEKFGRNCIKFKGCDHVYCDSCLKSYFDNHIKDGNMKALTCPEPGCDSQAFPAQIKNLVTPQDFERYESLLLQTTLDMMKDIMYCPRKFCQNPVIVEDDEVMGICSVCHYSFCVHCKLAYHGVEPCKLKQKKLKEICRKYRDGDSATRKELEGKYGAKVLRETIENMESEIWITANSKPCPGCDASIEKQSGCNKMTCYKCKCYFCWLCSQRLNLANPYSHYNTAKSKCYNKLFEGTVFDDEYDMFEDAWGW